MESWNKEEEEEEEEEEEDKYLSGLLVTARSVFCQNHDIMVGVCQATRWHVTRLGRLGNLCYSVLQPT